MMLLPITLVVHIEKSVFIVRVSVLAGAVLGQNIWEAGPSLSFPSPPLTSPPLLFPVFFAVFPLPLHSLFPALPLEVGPLNTARGPGSVLSFPSGVWGRAPAEIQFCAF